jgi:hypothetical protein
MIWNTWKQIVGHKNFDSNLEEFKNLLSNSFKEINSNVWGKTVRHVVREVEAKYYEKFNITSHANNSEHNYSFNCTFN